MKSNTIHPKILLIIVSALVLITACLGIRKRTYFNWGYVPYEHCTIAMPHNLAASVSKNELKKMVSNLYNTPHIYKEKSNSKKAGDTYLNSIIRIVTIRKELQGEAYALSYAHELSHVKYYCQNETYTSYITFVTLYESQNKVLKNVAERYACKVLAGCYKEKQYDCGYYILKYLNERSIKL